MKFRETARRSQAQYLEDCSNSFVIKKIEMATPCVGNWRHCRKEIENCSDDNSYCITKVWIIFATLFVAALVCLLLAIVHRFAVDDIRTRTNLAFVIIFGVLAVAMLVCAIVFAVI